MLKRALKPKDLLIMDPNVVSAPFGTLDRKALKPENQNYLP
jgi:hypothetical protein